MNLVPKDSLSHGLDAYTFLVREEDEYLELRVVSMVGEEIQLTSAIPLSIVSLPSTRPLACAGTLLEHSLYTPRLIRIVCTECCEVHIYLVVRDLETLEGVSCVRIAMAFCSTHSVFHQFMDRAVHLP